MFANSQSTCECRYERFIVALEEATKDTLPFLKEKALKVREQPHVVCSFEVFVNFSLMVLTLRLAALDYQFTSKAVARTGRLFNKCIYLNFISRVQCFQANVLLYGS